MSHDAGPILRASNPSLLVLAKLDFIAMTELAPAPANVTDQVGGDLIAGLRQYVDGSAGLDRCRGTVESPAGSVSPFPRFRHPEQLYRGYVSVVEFSDHDTRAAILDDLAMLGLPDQLDEPAFRQRAGVAFLAFEIVAALDEFVARPRYFGEMSEWSETRGVLAGQCHDDRKRYLQTVIR